MPIAIIGMHRSGTSMLARLLNICGMNLGDEEQINPDTHGNPKGHWEHLKFLNTNETVQNCLGGTSPWPRLFPDNWRDNPEIARLLNDAKESVATEFANSEPWGWKDPRTSLTLPFWQEVVPNLKYVVCVRNPLDVAASLKSRDSMPIAKSIALWHFYTVSSLLFTRPEDRILVQYEDLFLDTRVVLVPLLEFLSLPPLQEGSDQEQEAASSIDRGLKHHSHTLEDVQNSPEVPDYVSELYTAIRLNPANLARILPIVALQPRLQVAQAFIDAEAGRFDVGRLGGLVSHLKGEVSRLEALNQAQSGRITELTDAVGALRAELDLPHYRAARAGARVASKVPGLRSILKRPSD